MENKKIKLEYIGEYNNRTVITTIEYEPGMVINSKKLLSIILPTGKTIYNGKVVSSKTYQKNHPENKLGMGDDDTLVIDSEFSYPLKANENTYTVDELTVEEHSIAELKQRSGKTLDTEIISVSLNQDEEEMMLILPSGLIDMACVGSRTIYERKLKEVKGNYEFTLRETTPWTVFGNEKTQKEIEETASTDERYTSILEKMQEKEAESVIELPNGGFVIADEDHIPAKKLVK